MSAPTFFRRGGGLTLRDVAALTGATPRRGTDLDRRITGVAALDRASPDDLVFFDGDSLADDAAASAAGACLTTERLAATLPDRLNVLYTPAPFDAFVEAGRALFPDAVRPSSLFEAKGLAPGAVVHPSARLENGVTVEPGGVLGPGVEVGAGTLIGPGAVVGAGVRIGRNCTIGANATVTHALIGDRVIVHPGCAIGQQTFDVTCDGGVARNMVRVGRVIVQDDVEIGANTTIDRGAIGDTVIGEGTKIDNLVQIAQNASIGRHCRLAARVGVSGDVTIEDHVIVSAQVTVAQGLTIGAGAALAAGIAVVDNVAAGTPREQTSEMRSERGAHDRDPR